MQSGNSHKHTQEEKKKGRGLKIKYKLHLLNGFRLINLICESYLEASCCWNGGCEIRILAEHTEDAKSIVDERKGWEGREGKREEQDCECESKRKCECRCKCEFKLTVSSPETHDKK